MWSKMMNNTLPEYKLEWAIRHLRMIVEDFKNEGMTAPQVIELSRAVDAVRALYIAEEKTDGQKTNTTKTRNGELQGKSRGRKKS